MNVQQITNKISSVEDYIKQLRRTQDDKERQARQLDTETSELQSEVTQQLAEATRISRENEFVDATIPVVETQYQHQLEEKQREAQVKRDEAERINSDIAAAEGVVNELKKSEANLRDYFQTTQAWMDRADEVIKT